MARWRQSAQARVCVCVCVLARGGGDAWCQWESSQTIHPEWYNYKCSERTRKRKGKGLVLYGIETKRQLGCVFCTFGSRQQAWKPGLVSVRRRRRLRLRPWADTKRLGAVSDRNAAFSTLPRCGWKWGQRPWSLIAEVLGGGWVARSWIPPAL